MADGGSADDRWLLALAERERVMTRNRANRFELCYYTHCRHKGFILSCVSPNLARKPLNS